MSPDEFREAGHRLVDWIADFRATVEDRPVRASVQPGWARSRVSGPPTEPEPLERLLADLESTVLPGLSHFQHPSYFAFFPANASLASVLGDLASSGLGVLGLNLADQIRATEGWTVVAPVNLQTVCVRHEPPGLTAAERDAHTLHWVGAINDSGAAYLTPAVLDGRWMVRVSIGAEPTERRHIEALWQLMRATAEPEDLHGS